MEYFRQLDEQVTVDRWYSAQIAAECRRSYVAEPEKVQTKDFFHEFEEETPKKKKKVSNIETKNKGDLSKKIWLAAFGIKE